MIRRSLSERLRCEGLDVVDAGTGLDAVEKVRTGADGVLIDCDLPGIDAVAVLRRIRERDPCSRVIAPGALEYARGIRRAP